MNRLLILLGLVMTAAIFVLFYKGSIRRGDI